MVEFCDFVDSGGANVIRAWVDGRADSIDLDAAFTRRLEYLRQIPRHKWGAKKLTKKLRGNCDGLYELRFKVSNVPIRPLFCDGPEAGQITFLAGAIEHNNRLEPPGACARALQRKVLIGGPSHVCPSDFAP